MFSNLPVLISAASLDEKTRMILPVHKKDEESQKQSASDQKKKAPAGEPAPEEKEEKKEEDMPGGLADIIRDLTRRPRA